MANSSVRTPETREKLRLARLRENAEGNARNSIVTCPHCGFAGKHMIMQRHHFDNCKDYWAAKSTRLNGKKL